MDSADAASVWDVVPEDDSLYEAVFQEHFANTNYEVIAIFKALKVTDKTAEKRRQKEKHVRQTVGLTTRLMHDTMVIERQVDTSAVDTLRILVITVDKTSSPPNAKPALHKFSAVLENGKLNYKVAGARLSLHILKAIHLLPTPPSVKGTTGNILGTVWAAVPKTANVMPKLPEGFLQPRKSSTPFHYVLPTYSRRTAVACVLFLVARAFAGHKPALEGISETFVDAWAKRYIVERVPGIVPSTLQKVAFMNPAEKNELDTEWAALTEKEQAHMTGLLDIVHLTGKLDVSMLQQRLEAEHAAIEAANVQAILDSGFSIPHVLQKINMSNARLEDLKFALGVFDGKLFSMREDTEAIESANSALETQVKSLDGLQNTVVQLLGSLAAGPEISKLGTLSPTPANASALLMAMHALKKKLEFLSPDPSDKKAVAAALQPAVANMRVVSDFRKELVQRSMEFMTSLARRMGRVAGSIQLLTESRPCRLRRAPAEVLAYAPLLHMLPTLPGGPDALKEIQSHFLHSMNMSLHTFVKTEVAAAEAAIREKRGGRSGGFVEVQPALEALQNILPSVAHCMMLMFDFLHMREMGVPRTPKSGAVLSARANPAAPGLVMVAMGRLHVLREQGKAMDTLIELRDLMRPTVPIARECANAAAQVAINMRDPCRRLIKVITAQSYIPLLPFIAALSAWRKYLATYPAAARITEELKQLLVECTQELQQLQGAAIAAAERKEAQLQRTPGFGGDPKNIKGLGVIPKTEALATDAGAIAEMLRAGVPSLRWWWPWGDELEAMSADDLLLKVHEPVANVISVMYSNTLESLSRTRDKDAKHGTTFMLENLFYLKQHIIKLAGLVPDLLPRAKDLQTDLNSAQDIYIEEQLQWSKLWPLLLMAGKINMLLRDLNPREVQFQEGFSRATILQTIDAAYTDIDKKLVAISQRARKHLGSTPNLLHTVWAALEKSIILKLRDLENDVRACFPDVAMPLATEQVASYLQAAKPNA